MYAEPLIGKFQRPNKRVGKIEIEFDLGKYAPEDYKELAYCLSCRTFIYSRVNQAGGVLCPFCIMKGVHIGK